MLATVRLASVLAAAVHWARASDPCQCLNWKEVYDSKRVLCGEGWEFFFDSQEKTYESAWWAPNVYGFTYHEFCSSFFQRLDNNYCVNIRHHTYGQKPPVAGQWCYVSKECGELNGGKVIKDQQAIPEVRLLGIIPPLYRLVRDVYRRCPHAIHKRDVAMKVCSSGADTLLGEMPVTKVIELAQKMDSVIGFVTKTSYPTAKASDKYSPIWDDVKDAVATGSVDKLPPIVAKAVREKKPIIIDVDPEGHTGQYILVGKEVYELGNKCGKDGCGAAQWPFKRARDMGEL